MNEYYNEFNDYSFAKRMAILLATDIVIAIADAYIPHELSPVRVLVALIEFGFMAATMILAARNVLEDY